MKNVGILYPGEMGSALAAKLIKGGFTVLSCVEGRSKSTQSAAVRAGIKLLKSIDDVIVESTAVYSLIHPEHAISISSTVADAVQRTGRTPLFIDCNSVSPATVKEVAARVRSAGAECVDGSFIGSSELLGTKTVLYLSGIKGKSLAMKLRGILNVEYLSENIGDASALKMCFAGFNKGLISLFLEIACASGKAGNFDELNKCLHKFYPEIVKTVSNLLPSYLHHAHRRVKELDEMLVFLKELGQRPAMMPGTTVILKAFSELFATEQRSIGQIEQDGFAEILQSCIDAEMLAEKKLV